ncbi:tRNA (adenine(22)-N(1))-methyltransferase TrmK [Domibacillus sp.]|uniref:tRNA (adenine(22)-N(1))-methyltransferase n=1 Tax=Domibacillus sp. TaxID=1969783 RepID=UPI0028111247|nr:tRNA (adenine(22)-N(1))-methyltransferase TrmK [Domibacillus sp.]
MNSNQLSKRLETVVSFIEPARTIADIGSDHAYLPCYAVKKNLVDRAVAGEVVEGPFQSARRQVLSEGLSEKVDVRKGNGLAVLEAGEVECITIAGMGGPLIASILEEGKSKLAGVAKLILQPNIAGHAVREWLDANSWTIEQEAILEEDGQLYEIISATAGSSRALSPKELLFGPFLIKQKNNAFRLKWQRELDQINHVLSRLTDAQHTEGTEKKKSELKQKKQWIEEVIADENA